MGSIGETNKLGFANGFHGRAGQSIPGFMYQTYHVGVSNSALNTTFSVYLKQPVIREMKRVMRHLEEIIVTLEKPSTCGS